MPHDLTNKEIADGLKRMEERRKLITRSKAAARAFLKRIKNPKLPAHFLPPETAGKRKSAHQTKNVI